MQKDTIIGMIYRFDNNDYQISLAEFSEEDQDALQRILMKYDDDCACVRGDKNTTIADANIDYFER